MVTVLIGKRLKTPGKIKLRFGIWNVRTLTGKEVELVEEMRKRKIQLMGLSEVKKKGSGSVELKDGYVMVYSGVVMQSRAKEGVGVVMTPEAFNKVSDWQAINSRIMTVDLDLELKVTYVQVYAPTEDSNVQDKEEFYLSLNAVLEGVCSRGRQVIVGGDMNARIGNDCEHSHGVMGPYAGEQIKNSNGERLLEFGVDNNLLIGNTWFNHKRIHQITFEAEGRAAKSIIDYFMYSAEMRRRVTDVKVIRGAELDTDHRLVVMDLRMKVPVKEREKRYSRVHVQKLESPQVQELYHQNIEEEFRTLPEDIRDLDALWEEIKNRLLRAAEVSCGRKIVNTKHKRTKWWNDHVKELVKKKKDAWRKYLASGSEEDRAIYIQYRRQVKKEVREAKAKTWEEFGQNLEEKYNKDNKIFWKMVKGLRGRRVKEVRSIRNGDGILVSEQKDVLEAWRRYYEEKLCC
ncbi:uncharacterized protein LOC120352957 [Nilaparvata lugens]|uniref:uncharacterized protein LOC120352957 n=1 Tax=Nilaparvata lugens TaxID=108931 RepID=UPI00193CC4DF|nr:uncharacterized protein LOC120352957 [Nilaparvata lugens]